MLPVIEFLPGWELGHAKGLGEESELGLGPSSPSPAMGSKLGLQEGSLW